MKKKSESMFKKIFLSDECEGLSNGNKDFYGTICLPLISTAVSALTGQTEQASINLSFSISSKDDLKEQIFSLSSSNTSGATFIQFVVAIQVVRSILIFNPEIFCSLKSLISISLAFFVNLKS